MSMAAMVPGRAERCVVALLALAGAALEAQTIQKEYIRLGGRVIAIETSQTVVTSLAFSSAKTDTAPAEGKVNLLTVAAPSQTTSWTVSETSGEVVFQFAGTGGCPLQIGSGATSPISGTGSNVGICYWVKVNRATDTRTLNILLKDGTANVKDILAVIQQTLILSTQTVVLDAGTPGQQTTQSVSVTGGANITVVPSSTWNLAATWAMGSGTFSSNIQVRADAYGGSSARTNGSVTVKTGPSSPVPDQVFSTIAVSQVGGCTAVATQSGSASANIVGRTHSETFAITTTDSSCAWAAAVKPIGQSGDVSWLRVATAYGIGSNPGVGYTADVNTTGASRSARIVVNGGTALQIIQSSPVFSFQLESSLVAGGITVLNVLLDQQIPLMSDFSGTNAVVWSYPAGMMCASACADPTHPWFTAPATPSSGYGPLAITGIWRGQSKTLSINVTKQRPDPAILTLSLNVPPPSPDAPPQTFASGTRAILHLTATYNLSTAWVLIGPARNSVPNASYQSCLIKITQGTNVAGVTLYNGDGTATQTQPAPWNSQYAVPDLSSSQCSVNVSPNASSYSSANGILWAVTLDITFREPTFGGARKLQSSPDNITFSEFDPTFLTLGPIPASVSLLQIPNNGSITAGVQGSFLVAVDAPASTAGIQNIDLNIFDGVTAADSCILRYSTIYQQFQLATDQGNFSSSLSNTQCTVVPSGPSIGPFQFSFSVTVTFKAPMIGAHVVSASGTEIVGSTTRNITPRSGGLQVNAIAVTPSSVSMQPGTSQPFSASVNAPTWSASGGSITAAGLFMAPAGSPVGQAYVITASNGVASGSASVIIAAPPTFTVSSNYSSLQLVAGNATNAIITVGWANGASGTVTFPSTITSSPAGVTGNLSQGANNSAWTLAVSAPAGTASGTYTLSIRGSSAVGTQSNTLSIPVTVTGVPTGNWFNTSWTKRRLITVKSGSVISGPLTDFPMLVKITGDASLTANTLVDAKDLVFTDGGGLNPLNFEIESFNRAAGTLVAWVKVPSLTDGAKVYLYYGNAGVTTSLQNAGGVWSNGYAAVFHLSEAAVTAAGNVLADSTGHNSLSLIGGNGTSASVAGAMGGGVKFTGGTQYSSFLATTANPVGMGTANTTVEGWVNLNSLWASDAGLTGLFGTYKGGVYPGQTNYLALTTAGKLEALIGGESDASLLTSAGLSAGGGWHHVATTYDHNQVLLYIDGNLAGTTPMQPTLYDGPFQLNCYPRCTDASFDEVRASSTNRTSNWIKTQYGNQSLPDSFYDLGPVGTATGFTLSASPGSLTIGPGTSGTVNISVSWANGSNANVTFPSGTITSTPSGVTGSFSPVSTSTTTTLTVTVPAGTANGTYALTIAGTSGSGSQSSPLSVNVVVGSGGSSGNWYNPSWTRRRLITVQPSQVTGALAGFPMMVKLTSDPDLISNPPQVNGLDLLFTDGTGTAKIPHEIESFDRAGGSLVAWVKVPSMASGTTLYMYYGNAGNATDQQDRANVWDGNFGGVYHMKETSLAGGGLLSDSTGNGRHLTITAPGSGAGTVSTVGGAAGQGVKMTGGNQYNNYSAITPGNAGIGSADTTVEGWFYVNSLWPLEGAVSSLFGLAPGTYTPRWHSNYVELNYATGATSGTLRGNVGGESEQLAASSVGVTAGSGWHHVALTHAATGDQVALYLDGTQVGSGALVSGGLQDGKLKLNCVSGCSDASFDEVRVSSVNRTAAWISAEYKNIATPGGFASVAAVDTGSAGSGGAASWYAVNGPWSNRKKITVKAGMVSGSSVVSGFPVLFTRTDADMKRTSNGGKVVSATGVDIVFTKADGVTRVNHELESYDAATGNVVAWVNSDVSPSVDTTLYVYFGSSNAVANQSAAQVWDANYGGVYHLKESSLGGGAQLNDSTANGRHMTITATAAGSSSAVTGAIGQGVRLTGTNQYNSYWAETAGLAGIGAGNTTVEGWIYLNSLWAIDGSSVGLFGVKPGTYVYQSNYVQLNYTTGATSGILKGNMGGQSEVVAPSSTAVTAGGWHQVALTHVASGDAVKLYLDGQLVGSGNLASGGVQDGTLKLNCVYGCADASFDEVRVSSVNRSADWILTGYRNVGSQGTYVLVGGLE